MSAPGRERAPRGGFLLRDKPAGATSHDVVAEVRRELGVSRVGHAGTLDPFATGLLVVLVGRATRLQRYVLGLPKVYVATARLGWRSSTGDPEGELERTGRLPTELRLPTGTIRQRVPMSSAVKVGGERLYRVARRGERATRPVREVTVHRAELLSGDRDRATFEIECSAGTYVRTLIEELGDAYCERLRRTAIGHLRIEDASLDLRPIERLVEFLPSRELDREEARRTVNGIPPAADGEPAREPIRLMHAERLIAVARVSDGMLRTEVVLGQDD